MNPRKIIVNDLMQQDYVYLLSEPTGKNFHLNFTPQLSPKQMLSLGVFGGKYMTDCANEFPSDWFDNAKLCSQYHNPELNFFKINASLPLVEWQKREWIYFEDPRGWFQWYCRYYNGRRGPDDERQIKRHKAMVRHLAQVRQCPLPGDWNCRRKQRQALLHWAYDCRQL